MKKLTINTTKPYDIYIGAGILSQAGKLIKERFSKSRIALVSETNVFPLYGEKVLSVLREEGFDVVTHIFEAGEAQKNMQTVIEILGTLSENKLTRTDIVVALGGGVTGDMAGFASAIYLRGIKCVQIPTSYLAAVDSSTGGKTAVDLPAGKNLAGAFHMPSLVICDTDCFKTLSKETFEDGVAESIKHGLIADADFFRFMLENDITENIEEVVRRNVEIKTSFVLGDEKDTGKRQMLNFGHTIGHAAEKVSNFALTHGHAIAIGMAVVLRAQEKLGIGEAGMTEKLLAALKKYDLPSECPYSAEQLMSAALQDKKRAGDKISLVCLEKPGKAFLKPMNMEELEDIIRLGLE